MVRGQRNPLHLSLPSRLKKVRLARGLTREGLSLTAGPSNNTVLRIEDEHRIPGLDVVERLARALTVSPCTLAYGVEVPNVEANPSVELRCASIGERLRAAREQAGLSMRALGRAADLTPTAISNIEFAKVIPGVDVAESLATAMKISPCWLAFSEGEPRGPRFPPPIKKKRSLAPRRITKTTARRGR